MITWAVFVSGQGTNLQNFLELERDRLKKSRIRFVLADRECPALLKAQKFNKPTYTVDPKLPGAIDQMLKLLDEHQVDAIFLLGYMRILKREFLQRFRGAVVNLHPSLLPRFKGAHAIEDAYRAGEKTMGVTIHRVVEAVDSGKILRQSSIERGPHWTLDETFDEIHKEERKLVASFLIDLEENPSIVQNLSE